MSFSTNRPLGVPEAGLTGQAVVKLSNNDYDIGWGTGSGGGGLVASVFGRTGNILAQTGDYTSDQVTELSGATNQYFTTARARAAFSFTAPIAYSSGVYSIAAATTLVNGYLSSADWTTFNNKGSGNVTSVALSVPSWLTVSAAVTTTGTLAITATSGQTANQVMATPDGSSGAISLRALVANDIPNLDASKITSGFLSPAQGGSGIPYYGSGVDGDLTVAGTVNLTGDFYFNNLTISGAGNIVDTKNFRLFVAGTLDISGAAASSLRMSNNSGANATGATGGAARSNITVASLGADSSAAGVAGPTATTGAGTTPAANTDLVTSYGGSGGGGGAGGALGAVGAAGRGSSAVTVNKFNYFDINFLRGASLASGGTAGQNGSSGSGNGISAGGGGASGARGGPFLVILCNILKRDGTTAANAINVNGATGGNGGNAVGGGGGGGSGGGGAGCLYIVYNTLQGSTGTNILSANGGAGGNGGTGTAGYFGGTGGSGGSAGKIILINASTGTLTEYDGTGTSGSTAATPTTTAGTTGGAGGVLQVSL